jgi:23S rRNA pseudouridine2605 synthase
MLQPFFPDKQMKNDSFKSNNRSERPSFRKSDDRPTSFRSDSGAPRGDRPERNDRPNFSRKTEGRSERSFVKRPASDRPTGTKPTGYRSKFAERQEAENRNSFSDRKPRSFGDRDNRASRNFEDRGDRPQRNFGDRDSRPARNFGDRDNRTPRNFEDRGDRPQRNFGDRDSRPARNFGDRDSRTPRNFEDRGDRPQRNFGDRDSRPARNFGDRDSRTPRNFEDRGDRPFNNRRTTKERGDFSQGAIFRSENRSSEGPRPRAERKLYENRPFFDKRREKFSGNFDDKPYTARPETNGDGEQPRFKRFDGPYQPNMNEDTGGARYKGRNGYRTDGTSYDPTERAAETEESKNGTIRLNRYISNSGICSRRDADELIIAGQITVNGETITEMGYQVKLTDVVKYGTKLLTREKMMYVLLNKPKDYITTTEDPLDRKTVMKLIEGACNERIYPVGRLDRNTTGLLLLTNDGELASKLTHPSYEIEKVYQVEIDKPISEDDFQALNKGLDLEDGFIKPDSVGIVTPDAQVIGIKIHSGRNRIVRRMFEHLGYEVLKLDRTVFAGLNKKDLPRGNYRKLTEKEVIKLKYLS